jgi:anti-sigma B factor antagonist
MSDPAVTSVEVRPEAVVVHIQTDRLDEGSLKGVRADVSAAARESPGLPVILDMGQVNFMPSLSLGGIVQVAKEFQARKQRLMLAGLQPFVRETMTITRLDRVFEIHDDLAGALKASLPGL